MDKKSQQGIQPPRQLEEGFDPSRELWERLVDDALQRGGPCLATVEDLVDQACHLPAHPAEKGEDEPGGE